MFMVVPAGFRVPAGQVVSARKISWPVFSKKNLAAATMDPPWVTRGNTPAAPGPDPQSFIVTVREDEIR